VKSLTLKRFLLMLTPFAALFAAAMLICPLVGVAPMSIRRAMDGSIPREINTDYSLLFLLRLPRLLLASLAGSALAMAGASFQALLRNPLAEPYTLGVSSGAALGAVLAIKLGLNVTVFGISAVPIFAFAGSLSAMGAIYILARGRSGLPTSVLLLSGVTISFFFSSMILFVHYIADFTENQQMIRWMMGGLDIVGMQSIYQILPMWIVGTLAVLYLARDLNILSFGSTYASARGIDVPRTQKAAFVFASMMTGAVVSAAGPIGFVGLIVPHALRFVTGPDLRILVPASALAGAAFLAVCDTFARTILGYAEIPVGVLTAMIGGPFFLVLLARQKRRSGRID
jgi:iron complex transport system permease protein